MFSKAFGAYGLSKGAAVTIVRLPRAIQGLSEESPDSVPSFRHRVLIDGLNLILQDIEDKGINHRAVINLSAGLRPISLGPSLNRKPVLGDTLYPMYQTLEKLINMGAIFTTTSGNGGDPTQRGVSYPFSIASKSSPYS
jgi:hypothetical protein